MRWTENMLWDWVQNSRNRPLTDWLELMRYRSVLIVSKCKPKTNIEILVSVLMWYVHGALELGKVLRI